MDVLELRAHQPINHQHLQDLRQLAAPTEAPAEPE